MSPGTGASEPQTDSPRRVVLVSGLSGAGRSSILHCLEDLGYEAIDNPPLPLMEELVTRAEGPVAVGVDTRSRGFDPAAVLHALGRLRLNPALMPELVFAAADENVLLRRYTETRRRHPLAPSGRVLEGIAAEIALLAGLHAAADMVIDTSDLPLAALRSRVEAQFGGQASGAPGMAISLTSFAYPKGLPRDADLVFDARFLRNPHYDPMLRPKTGLEADVAAFVAADPDFEPFVSKVTELLTLLLPRFVGEGKKYAGIAVGCTGGRHRSVYVVQRLAAWLERFTPSTLPPGAPAWRVTITHRELLRETPRQSGAATGVGVSEAGVATPGTNLPAQAQEA